jgi:hypothetical protein
MPNSPSIRRPGRPASLQLPKTEPPSQKMTKAAFARWIGRKAPRLSQLIKQSVITEPAITAEGMIVPALAIEQMQEAGCFADADALVVDAATAASKVAEDCKAASLTYDEARTATETLKAHQALLDLRQRRGELIETAKADAVAFAAARAFRDGLQALPPRVVPEMAARLGLEPARLLAEMNASIRMFLTEISDFGADWRQGLR